MASLPVSNLCRQFTELSNPMRSQSSFPRSLSLPFPFLYSFTYLLVVLTFFGSFFLECPVRESRSISKQVIKEFSPQELILKLEHVSESSQELGKTQLAGPAHRISDSELAPLTQRVEPENLPFQQIPLCG